MLSRFLKIATLLSFLMVVVPGGKVSFYVWMMPLMMLYEWRAGHYLLFGTGLLIAVSMCVLLIAVFKKQKSGTSPLLVSLATTVLLVFVITFLSAIRQYGGQTAWLRYLNFLFWSVLTLVHSVLAFSKK
ncbi:MAG: hypothetical protein KGO92_07870 [Bacteroidota bacterium]|nr:hypothetical protein [Bacteroidota bacterium]